MTVARAPDWVVSGACRYLDRPLACIHTSIGIDAAPASLDCRALALVLQPALPRCAARLGRYAPAGRPADRQHHLRQTLPHVVQVEVLRAVSIAAQHEFTGVIHVGRESGPQPAFLAGAQSLRLLEFESQLDFGRDLVDVLSTRTAAAAEAQLQIGFGYRPTRIEIYPAH